MFSLKVLKVLKVYLATVEKVGSIKTPLKKQNKTRNPVKVHEFCTTQSLVAVYRTEHAIHHVHVGSKIKNIYTS